jgi:segregation and condensation protein A
MPAFQLPNFHGPIELLLYLVQKNELEVTDVPLAALTKQYLSGESQDIAVGAEFLACAAALLQIKSARLLPGEQEEESEARDTLESLFHISDYCELGKLADRLEQQGDVRFTRPPTAVEEEEPGLETVSAEELALMLQDLLEKAAERAPKLVDDEEWRVADAIEVVKASGNIPFFHLFSIDKPRGQLIALFLALLELMKMQKVQVIKQDDEVWIHGN